MPGPVPGKLIIFEGGDGTGKSTQALRLKNHLASKGHTVLHIREPGSTPLGERIRDVLLGDTAEKCVDISPETEMLLYMACRAELFRSVIQPALRKGHMVILERSYFSTYAYQGSGLGIDGDLILRVGDWACSGVKPFRVILLDMEVEESLARLGGRKDRIESRSKEFHGRVREGFLELARRFQGMFCIVDGDGEPQEVEARIHAEFGDLC